MSVSDLPTEVQEMGPIDFVCIEFPHRRAPGAGMQLLLHLVDQGIVRVLDLAFVRKEPDGKVRRVAISELGPEVAAFEGASSGMLDDQDIADAGNAIAVDSAAALMVYENRWAAPLASTLRREGAQLVAWDRLPLQALLAALDATEPAAV
jgi:Family of unknown function (DUF6325)